jgi:hypothetical protein
MEGRPGRTAQGGGDGPDVVVRIGVVSSPYVSRLLVASVSINEDAPFYVLADATQVPPADWLRVMARGGHGGSGESGARGAKGREGATGCPGAPGGAGGAGGNGGPGGPGGRGGRVTIYVSDADPFLAGLVDARTPGGHGGEGGSAGKGGDGGKGGAPSTPNDRRCAKGTDGSDGPNGAPGEDGRDGRPGLRPEIVTLPDSVVFGQPMRGELAELIRLRRSAPAKGN